MSRFRVSMDIGGTFTDLVSYDEQTGTYAAAKVSTTPRELTEGVLAGLADAVESVDDITFNVHGTTVGLNAFLQRKGERVLLLATRGAGDTYHIARGNRLRLYDVHYRKPTPLLPRRDIVEIGGRLNYAGDELEPLSESDIRAAARRVREEGFGAVAVGFLFAFFNPMHELRAEEILREELDGVAISLSHRIAREWREYERTSSTVLEAYTAPTIRRYLERLENELQGRGLTVPLHVMQSSGGVVTAVSAREWPLQTLLSGPVGGTMGLVALARQSRRPNLIGVDMGGTSFDVSLVVDGKPDISSETTLEGFPLMMPIVNIHTIGAGGGSVAHLEAGGLRVGPESAGADPGPACYGRGGTRPTVTDANLVLGRIDPQTFAGGRMQLHVEAAERAVGELAAQLGLGTVELAEGICDVIDAKMAQAIRTLTVEQGIEPRDFALVAFGGAGPMHAAFLAQELEIGEVIVPRFPGAFSAWGMLECEIRCDFGQSFFASGATADLAGLAALFRALESEGRAALAAEGIPPSACRVEHAVDVRYEAQEYSLTIPVKSAADPLAEDFLERLADRFHEAHQTRYGHANPGAPIELVVARTAALGDLGRIAPEWREPAGDGTAPPARPAEVIFGRRAHQAAIVDRADLQAGMHIDGPAIVEEDTATTVVPPGCSLEVDGFGSLVIAVGKED